MDVSLLGNGPFLIKFLVVSTFKRKPSNVLYLPASKEQNHRKCRVLQPAAQLDKYQIVSGTQLAINGPRIKSCKKAAVTKKRSSRWSIHRLESQNTTWELLVE